MKRELYWLGGIGLGAGLMYWFDPARGRHRRARTRAQLLSARHHVGDLMADATPDLHNLPRPHLPHLPRRYRGQLMSPFQRQRQRQQRYWGQLMSPFQRQRQPRSSDVVLLALGGLGVIAALAWMVQSRNYASPSGKPISEAPLQAIGDWACGAWDGIRTWFRPSDEVSNATSQPHEREHEMTMMGNEAESTRDAESR